MSFRLAWTIPLVGLVCAACAGQGRPLTPERPVPEEPRQETIRLRVQNQNIHDASVFLREGGERTLLGTVDTRSVEFFQFLRLPGPPLNLEVELIVGDRHRFRPYPVMGGGRIELYIASELRRSTIR